MSDVSTPLTPLAEASDVQAALRRALTPDEEAALPALIAQASAKMRQASGRPQGWTAGTTTSRLKVTGRQACLPEPPTVVHSVVDERARPVRYRLRGQWLDDIALAASSSRFVTVTWSHDETVPDDVRGAVAGMVARVLAADPRAIAGFSSVTDTTGPFGQTNQIAAWAQGGQILLSPDDMRVAAAHRPRGPRLWVMRP